MAGADSTDPSNPGGLFIVLEGADGAGTTTQSQRLAESLRERGWRVHVTQEPSKGPVGLLLRQVLSGRLTVPSAQGARMPSWSAMALMFATDRLDHLEAEIVPHLDDGVTVICDRYDHSSLVYQSATGGGSPDDINWIREINRFARRPDLTIVLDVSAETARRRRSIRPGDEVYDNDRLQQTLCELYRNIDQHFSDDRILHVDAEAPLDQVAQAIVSQVVALR
jgi:dTMP kinase